MLVCVSSPAHVWSKLEKMRNWLNGSLGVLGILFASSICKVQLQDLIGSKLNLALTGEQLGAIDSFNCLGGCISPGTFKRFQWLFGTLQSKPIPKKFELLVLVIRANDELKRKTITISGSWGQSVQLNSEHALSGMAKLDLTYREILVSEDVTVF